ncbi:MAG: UDP-N-acetylmuramate:L-alanyl-gamma-D-glutamyl-meso-diaminopimelate ligase, partial [Pseudomonadota bacterium]|nr:UDP-N-acetylmuramate:L-alanyl-gamma-D-glutamyl-meso-diaminopimelate ligase [Pseudomonadota bacterium]
MHCHILGICGTFMAGIALLAKEAGHEVSGSDAGVYPPMSTMLDAHGIEVRAGYRPEHLEPTPDCVIIGNALSRGNPEVEAVLTRRLEYASGPEWLRRHVLKNRTVLAVAGTHGKTTTASILAWILEDSDRQPGFLIGGKPGNFDGSARLGAGKPFVVEADEYDTAFFDKRSKFVHYRPAVAVLNNLEFDHADIFDDIGQIRRQFHHLVRTIPGDGRLIVNRQDNNLDRVLAMGCWTPVEYFSVTDDSGIEWRAQALCEDCSRFSVLRHGRPAGEVEWELFGRHNMSNALAAIAAAHAIGVESLDACRTLAAFTPTVKRLQLHHDKNGIRLY